MSFAVSNYFLLLLFLCSSTVIRDVFASESIFQQEFQLQTPARVLQSRRVVYVNPKQGLATKDCGNSSSTACLSLLDALGIATKSSQPSTILLAKGLYTGPLHLPILLLNVHDLHLESEDPFSASGVVLDGEHCQRILRIQNSTRIVIRGLTLTNGSPGQMLCKTPGQNVYHSSFQMNPNDEPLKGGAAFVSLSSGVMEHVSIVNSLVDPFAGGGFAGKGGGIYIHCGAWLFEDCEFNNNTGGPGGAVFVGGNGNITFNRCLWVKNESPVSFGGGIVPEESSDVYIYNSVFRDNFAHWGGAIDDGADAITHFHNTVFIYNHAVVGGVFFKFGHGLSVMEECVFEGNTAQDSAGAIYAISGRMIIRDSLFRKNIAKYAGALRIAVNADIENTILEENIASTSGGSIVHVGAG